MAALCQKATGSATMAAQAEPLYKGPMSLTHAEIRTVIIGAMLSLFLAALDQTIVATALPAIGADLGDVWLLPWVVTSYMLTATAATLVFGKLADLKGRRPVLALAIGLFLLGSVACALAPTIVTLVLARGLQGLGGGALGVIAQTIVADVVPPRERGRYAAYFSSTWAAAGALGPTLGGLLSGTVGWPWIFWLNLPFGIIALVVTEWSLSKVPTVRHERRIDWLSVATLTAATSTLLVGLSLGGHYRPWSSPEVIGLLVAAPVLAWLFLRRQGQLTEPVLSPTLMADRVIRPVLLSSTLMFAAYVGLAVLTPIYLHAVVGLSSDWIGVVMLGPMVCSTVTAGLTGRWIRKTGRYRRPPLLGLPVAVVALTVLAFVASTADWRVVTVLLALYGFGIGPSFPVSTTSAQNAVARDQMGAVTGAIGLSRSLGGALGIGAGGALLLGLALAWVPAASGAVGLDEILQSQLAQTDRVLFGQAFGVLYGAIAATTALSLWYLASSEERPLRDSLN